MSSPTAAGSKSAARLRRLPVIELVLVIVSLVAGLVVIGASSAHAQTTVPAVVEYQLPTL